LGSDSDDSFGVTSGGDDSGDVGAVTLGVISGGRTAGEVPGLEDGGLKVGMFEGDSGI
jgi:hypothetical protein